MKDYCKGEMPRTVGIDAGDMYSHFCTIDEKGEEM